MKLLQALFLAAVVGFVLQSCNDENLTNQPDLVNVQFSSNVSSFNNGGRILNEEEPSHLLISVETLAGVSVLILEKIELYKLGSSYISEPVPLPLGTYKVYDFLLVTESNEVVYAVPKYGSPMAKAVSEPLPFQFYVGKDDVFQFDLEVLSVSGYEAKDLGYASFESEVVNPLRVAVFTNDQPHYPTNASAAILKDGDTIRNFSLEPKINMISFPGDTDSEYSIVVKKSGYGTFVKDFNYEQLIDSLDNLLLEVTLQKAFTILAHPSPYSGNFEMALGGESGTVHVDFGDGTSQTYSLTPNSGTQLSHNYPPDYDNYLMTITGDIHLIEDFYSYYGDGVVDEVDFTVLPGLEDIRLGLTYGPSIIDLSNNPKLKHVNVAGIWELESFILPQTHFISFIDVGGPNQLNTADIDEIIDNIHRNAVSNNQMNGIFSYILEGPPVPGEVVGPPSASAVAKLIELRDSYSWIIEPELD